MKLALGLFYSLAVYTASTLVSGALEIQSQLYWQGKPIKIPSDTLHTSSGEKLIITRADFLISQPEIRLTEGKKIANKSLNYFFSGEEPESIRIDQLPKQSFNQLTFYLGPAKEANHSKPATYPTGHALDPLHNNLHWSPQGGYIFLAIEGNLPDHDSAFAYHYGNDENRLKIPLDLTFTSNSQLAIRLHLDQLFSADFDLTKNRSTHSRAGDPTLEHFKKQLPGAFSLHPTKFLTEKEKSNITADKNLVGTPYPFTFPSHFPKPALPEDFPMTKERITLGKRLFHDKNLSVNGKISCFLCHRTEAAFSDPRQFSFGHAGELTERQSMTLVNLAWKNTPLFWDGRVKTLRKQVIHPIVDPIEMGESMETLLPYLQKNRHYQYMFNAAFGDKTITEERLAVALEQFTLSLTSTNSKMDRAVQGKEELTEQEKRGFKLFMTENDPRTGHRGADCFHCHGGPLFTNHRFHNNGLPPTDDLGLEKTTGKITDRFKFSTPTLRNIAITAPYMHDGRFETLEEVVDFYSEAPHHSPTLDPNIAKHGGTGLQLTDQEKADLIAFLKTLTDEKFIER